MQRLLASCACLLTLVAASSTVGAGERAGLSSPFSSCGAPFAAQAVPSCGGMFAAHPYAGNQYGSYSFAVPTYGRPGFYSGPPVVYTAPYAVAPVSFSLNQPVTMAGCSGAFGAESYGLLDALTIVERVLDLIGRLRDGADPGPSPDVVAKHCQEYDARLKHIETYLKQKDPDFKPLEPKPSSGGVRDPVPPVGADPTGRSMPAPSTSEQISALTEQIKLLRDELAPLRQSVSRMDEFLRAEFKDRYE